MISIVCEIVDLNAGSTYIELYRFSQQIARILFRNRFVVERIFDTNTMLVPNVEHSSSQDDLFFSQFEITYRYVYSFVIVM